MTQSLIRHIVQLVAGLAGVVTLSAQTWEFGVTGGKANISRAALGSVSAADPKNDDSELKGLQGYGVRLTLNTRGYYGHEIGYIRTSARFRTLIPDEAGTRVRYEDKIWIHQGFYNFLMYFMPKGERWRPFFTGGFEMQQYGTPHVPEWESAGGKRKYGVNYGGGLKLRIQKHALLRIDVRDYITGKPYNLFFEETSVQQSLKSGGFLRQLETSFGVTIGF